MDLLEQQLKALADKNRLTLLACMKNGEVCVCDFVEVLGISQPAVSQQLKKLKDAGIILERKKVRGNITELQNNFPLLSKL